MTLVCEPRRTKAKSVCRKPLFNIEARGRARGRCDYSKKQDQGRRTRTGGPDGAADATADERGGGQPTETEANEHTEGDHPTHRHKGEKRRPSTRDTEREEECRRIKEAAAQNSGQWTKSSRGSAMGRVEIGRGETRRQNRWCGARSGARWCRARSLTSQVKCCGSGRGTTSYAIVTLR